MGRYRDSENGLSALLLSALAGGVAAGALALLFSPKNGKQWRKTLCDTYEDLSERVEDWKECVEETGENLSCSASDLCDKAKDFYHHFFPDHECHFSNRAFAVAGVAGAVLAAVGTFYVLNYAPKNRSSFQYFSDRTEDIVHTLSDRSEDWLKLAQIVFRKFNKTFNMKKQHVEEKLSRAGDLLSDILDLAHFGINVAQKMKRRR